MTLDPLIGAVLHERPRRELSPAIGTQGAKPLARLDLQARLKLLDRARGLILGRQQDQPHETAPVVHDEQEHPLPAGRLWCDRSAQVRMHQFQGPRRAELARRWERLSMLLPGETALAHLLHMVDRRQATDHILLRQQL